MAEVKITEGWLQGCYGENGMVRGHGWEMAEDAWYYGSAGQRGHKLVYAKALEGKKNGF